MRTEHKQQPMRAAAAAFFGTTIEWYDYFCYATAASLVFGDVFFATDSKFAGLLASLATFAVGFVARPFGAVIFGHLGDKVGRKESLVITLWLMGLATALIGLLPSYHSVGVTATVLLVILRLIQGIAVGGEWGGAVLMAAEHAPQKWRTFLSAAPQYGSPVGLIMATLMFSGMASLSEADFKSWGWRVPFLLSIVMVLIAYFIRRGVNESPELLAYKARTEAHDSKQTAPLRLLLTQYKRKVAMGIGLSMMGIAGFYFITTLMIGYTTTYLGVSRSDILSIVTYTGVVQLICYPIGSYLATKFGERRLILFVSAGAAIWAIPMINLINTGITAYISIAILGATVFIGLYYSVLAAFLPRAFPIEVRYSGVSLSFQLCGALFGGTTPMLGLWIAQHYGIDPLPLAGLFAFIALSTFLGALLLPSDRVAKLVKPNEATLARSELI
ncbi:MULTISPECIES: MFS transporter [unclassified Pseudomonas]|uniref:MFS transporter n=1 Tax=unclassified Pseudomonas TaxID=196821 RepID=UPI00215C2589|nr:MULTISPECIES: MFS transporter [unclassified Pseudomonas]MCR8932242.1 MHS family MFS transporter [Pseudomonas sp. S11A4]MCR8975850.1 MHS family MFS transporter [Pseudomonas sp. S11P7]